MISAKRSQAENRFAALERRQLKVLNEHEEAERAVDENTARLRALRLAKEAEDRAAKPAK
jgi:hypothetical protein